MSLSTIPSGSAQSINPDSLLGVGLTRAQIQHVIDEEEKRRQRESEAPNQIDLEEFVHAVERRDVSALRALVARCSGGIPQDNHKALTSALWKQFDPNIADILNRAKVRWGAVFPHLDQILIRDDAQALAWVLTHVPGTRKYLYLQAYSANRPGPAIPDGERAFDQGQRASFWDTDKNEPLWSVMDAPVSGANPDESDEDVFQEKASSDDQSSDDQGDDLEDPLSLLVNRWKDGVGPNCLQYLALHTPAVAWVLDHPDQFTGNMDWIDGLADWIDKITRLHGHFETMDFRRTPQDMHNPQEGLMRLAGILSTGGYWHPQGTANLDFWTKVPLYQALLEHGCIHLHMERALDIEKDLLGFIAKFQGFPKGMTWLEKAIRNPIQMMCGDFGAPYNDVVNRFFQLRKLKHTWANAVHVDRIVDGDLLIDPQTVPFIFSTETPARNLLDLLVLSGQPEQLANILAQPILARSLWDRMAQPDGLVFSLIALADLKPRTGLDMVKDPSIRNWRDRQGNNAAHWIVWDWARQIRPSEVARRGQSPDGAGQMAPAFLRLARAAPDLMSAPNNLGFSPTALLPKDILVDVDRELLKHGVVGRNAARRTRARRL